jgi:hypothetical protein
MHRSGRSAAIDFRDFFGGHSVMVAVRVIKTMRSDEQSFVHALKAIDW